MANNAIIQAAGAAYKPVQGQYDLSGFINGITAVAAGVVKQGQIRKKMQSDLNKFYFPSANPQVQAVAEAIKAKVMDPKENFSVQEGINALKTLEYQIKTVLPKINTKFGDIDKKGLAGSVEPFAENYVNNIATGQLDQTIKIGNETASAVYRVNPQTLGLEIMGMNGSFTTPELLYANLGNLPTLDTASKPTTKMIGYVDDKFAKGEKGSWKETSDGITNYFNNQIIPNKKVFLAFLSDNMDGFTITNKKGITEEISWYDHYMDQTMDENQKALVQPILDDITDPEVLKRTKQIYMNELMKGDKNLKKDFNSYLEKIKSAKDPGDIIEATSEKSLFNPKTTSGSKIQEIDNLFNSIPDGGKYAMKFGDNKVFFTPTKSSSGVDNFTGDYTILDNKGNAVKDSSTGKPITFNAYDPSDIKYALGRVADRYLSFSDLPEYNYYIANVDLSRFVIKGNPVVGADTPVGANTKYNSKK